VSRGRVDDFWSGVFGVGSLGDGAGRAVLVEHGESLEGYAGVYCVLRRQTVLISAPPHLLNEVTEWHPSVETVMDARWLSDRLKGWSVLGPSVHSFLDRSDRPAAAVGETVPLAAEPVHLQQLRDRVTDAEWAESGFAGDDIAKAWVVAGEDGRTLGASNLTPFSEVPADVGVITDPAARGRGFATVAAATAALHAVELHGIARWRSLATNAPSRRLAAKLGFEDDCVQLAVRPS
jgi:RimJ/RimL family protein N-acetyltransferase